MSVTPKQLATSRKRTAAFLPEGKPRWVHLYDNGGRSFDRYTAVMTGRYADKFNARPGFTIGVGMSAHPFHPQGFGQHFENRARIDWPTYGHLGKKIKFEDLPVDCQRLVLDDYAALWDLPITVKWTERGARGFFDKPKALLFIDVAKKWGGKVKVDKASADA
jgi:hypothetical protein